MIMQNMALNNKAQQLLKQMIGCEFDKIVHDEFTYTNSVYGRVSLFINDRIYSIDNETKVVEFYGDKEDIAIIDLKEINIDQVKSLISTKKQIDMPIRRIIKSIDIINYHINVKYDKKEYDNTWTEGIIFDFGDKQLSFERTDSFTEMIEINKGYDLITKFSKVEDYANSFNKSAIIKTNRDIVKIL